jgi:hypothetical protein
MLVKDIDWNAYGYPVAEASETIDGKPVNSTGGMPSEFLGSWDSAEEPVDQGDRLNYLGLVVSPFYIMVNDYYDYKNGTIVSIPAVEFIVVSCTPKTGGLYEVIVIQPVYVVGSDFPTSTLTANDVNKAFLDYLKELKEKNKIDIDDSTLLRCYNRDDLDISDGKNRYIVQDNDQAGVKTNFLSDDQEVAFQLIFMQKYCITNGFQPIPTYSKFDAKMDGSDFVLIQYKEADDSNSFLTLHELDDLTLKQEPFVCKRH